MNNFIVLDSDYGKFIVNRHCSYQAEYLVKTGRTHIEHELNNIFAIIDTLPENSLIIDGGANIGFFAIPVAQRIKNKGGNVVCFEPQRMLFNALAGTIAINDLDNVFIHKVGLSDKKGEATLPEVDYSKPADFGTVSLIDNQSVIEETALRDRTVDLIALDSLNPSKLDLLKLDIEGYEIPAIKGALKSIQKHRPWLWIEYWIAGEQNIKNALSTIQNYEYICIDNLNMLCAPKEKLAASNLQIIKN